MVAPQKVATYDFDVFDVIYAAKFTAFPFDYSLEDDNWLVKLAGGRGKNIEVQYGIVALSNSSSKDAPVLEEFLRVEGENGSKRFLSQYGKTFYQGLNGLGYGLPSPCMFCRFSHANSFFWTVKKMRGKALLMDFSTPVYSLIFTNYLSPNRGRGLAYLSASNDGLWQNSYMSNLAWDSHTKLNLYQSETSTYREAGLPSSKDWLESMTAYAKEHPELGITGFLPVGTYPVIVRLNRYESVDFTDGNSILLQYAYSMPEGPDGKPFAGLYYLDNGISQQFSLAKGEVAFKGPYRIEVRDVSVSPVFVELVVQSRNAG